jgi:Kef-type K+ transport system membrane component KefB
MNTGGTPTRFQRFVAMRRKWFGAVFVITFVLCGIGLRGKYHSLVELVGFSLAGALLLTTLISLASIPVAWALAGRHSKP